MTTKPVVTMVDASVSPAIESDLIAGCERMIEADRPDGLIRSGLRG